MLLNNQWITEDIKKEIKKYLDTNETASTTTQNLWDIAKADVRRKLKQVYFRASLVVQWLRIHLPMQGTLV